MLDGSAFVSTPRRRSLPAFDPAKMGRSAKDAAYCYSNVPSRVSLACSSVRTRMNALLQVWRPLGPAHTMRLGEVLGRAGWAPSQPGPAPAQLPPSPTYLVPPQRPGVPPRVIPQMPRVAPPPRPPPFQQLPVAAPIGQPCAPAVPWPQGSPAAAYRPQDPQAVAYYQQQVSPAAAAFQPALRPPAPPVHPQRIAGTAGAELIPVTVHTPTSCA